MPKTALRTAAIALLALAATSAQAQLFRAYLSINGNDANACTLPAPCRLLPKALATVAANGEIWMLDSANYNGGTVTIDKSVTILAVPGAVGSVVSVGNGAAALDVTASGLTITLRNLSITALAGAPGTTNALTITGSSKVILEDSLVAGFNNIAMQAQAGSLMVMRSSFTNNINGVIVSGTGAATIAGSRFLANGIAVMATGTSSLMSSITIDNSVFSNNVIAVRAVGSPGIGLVFLNRSHIEGSLTAALFTVCTDPTGLAQIFINGNSIQRNPGAAWQITAAAGGTSLITSLGGNNFVTNGASVGPAIQPASSLPAGSLI